LALQSCRIGNVPNAIQWDDAVHTGAIETTQVIKAGNPVAANDVVTLATLGTYISSAAVIADHAIVRGDGGARGVQDSLVTIDDIGNISLAALATVDGVDISVHAGNANAHHAQSHNAVSHSDIASSGANIDDAVAKKHAQGTDTALGGVGTKNPPINADKVIYRDSTAADVLVTSTWTQIKAFLKTYLDTLYEVLGTEGEIEPANLVPAGGSITMNGARNTLTHTKIGRKVTVIGGLKVSSVSSPTGTLSLVLPFAAGTNVEEEFNTRCIMHYSSISGSPDYVVGWIVGGSDIMNIHGMSGGVIDYNLAARIVANSNIFINVTYFTD